MSSDNKNNKKFIQIILFITLVSITVAFGTIFDVTLLRGGLSPLTVLIVANALTGAAAALVHLQRAEHETQRLLIADENLKILREMNHEVRSVLGVVAFYGKQTRNDYVMKAFESSFKRMDGLMREVLGRGSVDPLPDPRPEVPAQSGLHIVGGKGRTSRQSSNRLTAVVPVE